MPTGLVDGSFTKTQQDLWTTYLKPRVVHIQGVSLRDEKDVIQHARQKIDDEVAGLLNAVSALRTHRNTFSRIYSLPSEVLGRVFHFLDKNIHLRISNRLDWIQVTHVCRFWRETALQNPSLWSEVTDLLGRKWTAEMFLRAKSVPISYSPRFFGRILHDKVIPNHVIAEHLFHMHRLSMAEPARVMNAALQAMITFPAPILDSLCLDGESSRPDERCVLPFDIFNAHSPKLRRLELRCIDFTWSAPILRGLTDLHIDNIQYHRHATENSDVAVYTQFFCALREMSALENLFLSWCLPEEPVDRPNIQNVMLSRVKKLTLRGDTIKCAGVVKHLTILPSCDVTVECRIFDPVSFQGINSFVKSHTLSDANHPRLLTMCLSTAQAHSPYDDPKWQLRFSAAGSPPDLTCLHQDQADVPSISILDGVEEEDLKSDLLVLCQCLPKDIIRDLVITPGDIVWTLIPQDWVLILREYTAVENMSVTGEVAHTLGGALGIPRSGLQEGTDEILLTHEQLFLGNLKRVEFNQVDFHHIYETEHLENDETDFVIGTSVYDTLKTSLSRRHATHLTLFIRRCSINPEQILGLQEVADVDWDFVQIAPQEE